MSSSELFSYFFIIGILTITPGADTMLVLRNVFASGKKAGIITAFGISCGLLVYAVISALGISIVLTKSPFLFRTIKIIGAGYLIYLGATSLRSFLKTKLKQPSIPSTVKSNYDRNHNHFIEGFLSNLFNPKIIVFYLTLLPQFINTTGNIILQSFFLTSIHIVLGILWLSFLSVFIGGIPFIYTSIRVRHTLEAISGSVMILFGILLLFER